MKTKLLKLACGLALCGAITTATAQSTFDIYSFQAGLANITDASALTVSPVNEISYLTDNSLTNGVANIGANGGTLAGNFGGGTYFHGTGADIVLVGAFEGSPAWGGFTVSLQLSSGSYTPGLAFADANLVTTVLNDNFTFIQENGGGSISGDFSYCYLPLDISGFDTGGLGVTGIEINNMTAQYPDISYIGVTSSALLEAVPEPATLALAGLGVLGCLLMFWDRKSRN